MWCFIELGFPGGPDCKESTWNAGDLGSISGSGRSPREVNGYPLQYSCLQNSMDGGAWWATAHGGHKEFNMTERPSTYTHILLFIFGFV